MISIVFLVYKRVQKEIYPSVCSLGKWKNPKKRLEMLEWLRYRLKIVDFHSFQVTKHQAPRAQ
jgi:hypothetical protein